MTFELDDLKLSVVPEENVGADLDARIRDGLCACFPADAGVFSKTRVWHGSVPTWSVVLEAPDKSVVSHAEVVDRTIRVGEIQTRVAGVGACSCGPRIGGGGCVIT